MFSLSSIPNLKKVYSLPPINFYFSFQVLKLRKQAADLEKELLERLKLEKESEQAEHDEKNREAIKLEDHEEEKIKNNQQSTALPLEWVIVMGQSQFVHYFRRPHAFISRFRAEDDISLRNRSLYCTAKNNAISLHISYSFFNFYVFIVYERNSSAPDFYFD